MKIAVLMLLSVLFNSFTSAAELPAEKGKMIVQKANELDTGFKDFSANMIMGLRNKYGQESTREIRVQVLEGEDDGDKSLIIFDSPKDVKGTAFLNFTHKVKDDDRWLYLPALKRVKRISASNKSGSFMGSEFSYEDISNQEIEKYTYKWLRDEVLNGHDCFVVEYYPVDQQNSGYIRQVTWIDKEIYKPRKIDYYDRKGSLLKTLSIEGYSKYLNKYWRAGKMNMINHQTGKSTRLDWKNYQFQAGLEVNDFNQNSLQRIR